MNVDPPPSNTAGDHIHTAARMAISALPYVGGPGLEFFNSVIAPPWQRRQREWMDRVAESIHRLEAAGRVSLADLQKDDGFVDVVLQASQAAVRTNEDEKRQALLNAVLNSALPHPPANSKREVFIAWLDSLTVWHLRLFRLFADPVAWFRAEGKPLPQIPVTISLETVLWQAYPQLRHDRQLYDKLVKDLHGEGLIKRESVHVKPLGGAYQSQATDLGREFLAFIMAPETSAERRTEK